MRSPGHRGTILVADDEPGFREMLGFTLEPLGFSIVDVADGLEALEKIRKRAFDLVILDVNMPRMAGPETMTRIHELRPAQRIILLSSALEATGSFATEDLPEGTVNYLFKPVDLDELIAAIEQALDPSVAIGGSAPCGSDSM